MKLDGVTKAHTITHFEYGLHVDWDTMTRTTGTPRLIGILIDLPALASIRTKALEVNAGIELSHLIDVTVSRWNSSGGGDKGIGASILNLEAGTFNVTEVGGQFAGMIIDLSQLTLTGNGQEWYGYLYHSGTMNQSGASGGFVKGFGTLTFGNNYGIDFDAFSHVSYNTNAVYEINSFYSELGSALSQSSTWRGLYLNWSTTSRSGGAPILEGIRIELPNSFTNFGTSYVGYFSGAGSVVSIIDGTNALYIQQGSAAILPLFIDGTGSSATVPLILMSYGAGFSEKYFIKLSNSSAWTAFSSTATLLWWDLVTNVTVSSGIVDWRGLDFDIPAHTTTNGSIRLLDFRGNGAITNTSPVFNWYGMDLTMPALTRTGGTLTAYGINISIGAISGTVISALIKLDAGPDSIGIDFSAMAAGEINFKFVADATDPTGGGGAATGRIAIDIGGSTVYIPYY